MQERGESGFQRPFDIAGADSSDTVRWWKGAENIVSLVSNLGQEFR